MQRILNAIALVGLTFVFTGCSKGPEEAAISMMEDMASIIEKNQDDCDKLAGELGPFMDKHTDTFKAIKEFGAKQSEADKKASQEKYKGRAEAAQKKMEAGMKKCATNEKVMGAMMKMAM